MTALFNKVSSLSGVYVFFMVNRMQALYLVLLMPAYLVHPHMIWGIIIMGILSHFNLWMLSKSFSSGVLSKGYEGFVQLFGTRLVRILAFVGLFMIFIKITVLSLGYIEIANQFILPSINSNWLVLFLFIVVYYLASQGIEKTILFSVIAFFSTIWLMFTLHTFLLPPIASIHDLYPLIPTEWSMDSWKALLLIWASLSGPEYLIFLSPWLNPEQNKLKYWGFANALAILEYLLLFISSLFFFGSDYLEKIKYPVANMIRYLQWPLFERIDILLISFYMFHFVFIISLYLLYFYGATRIILGRVNKQTSKSGFAIIFLTILVSVILINSFFWSSEVENFWLKLQVGSGAITYIFVPALLLLAIKRKGHV
ncbi:GerAB/ArcD/ProY family transporter [Radiobacillus sp. PE A8.2]|uniref:GerAB/ArcD/ProY family transporter n=1 Tax=Radiobacillus sp. PE A8.2 TaxID=3380349 RepID=UPI00388E31C3